MDEEETREVDDDPVTVGRGGYCNHTSLRLYLSIYCNLTILGGGGMLVVTSAVPPPFLAENDEEGAVDGP